jgi:hypothetical protein
LNFPHYIYIIHCHIEDFTGHVSHPVASYSPAYEFGLEEIAASCGALYPGSMTLDPDEKSYGLRWWDSGRRLITTRMDVSADDLRLSLLPSLQTFSHRYVATTVGSLSGPALNVLSGQLDQDFAASVKRHIESESQEELQIICDLLQIRYVWVCVCIFIHRAQTLSFFFFGFFFAEFFSLCLLFAPHPPFDVQLLDMKD